MKPKIIVKGKEVLDFDVKRIEEKAKKGSLLY